MGPKASLGWDSDSKVGTVSDKEMARARLGRVRNKSCRCWGWRTTVGVGGTQQACHL